MVATLAERKKEATGFGPRLRALRLAAGLTQKQLADRVGMHYQNLARLERGTRGPSWETVLKLADALGVSTEEFRDEEPGG